MKHFLFASIAAIVLTSCAKEPDTSYPSTWDKYKVVGEFAKPDKSVSNAKHDYHIYGMVNHGKRQGMHCLTNDKLPTGYVSSSDYSGTIEDIKGDLINAE